MSGTEDSGNALTAVGFPDGSSVSVYKSDAYDSANPEYRVRYWDKEGNYTDTNVQINDVDPRNASYLEMLAYTTYSDVEGFTKNAFGDFMNAAGGVNGNITYDSDSINEKKDYMSTVSYTHLTLPTKRIVEISVVRVSLKKKRKKKKKKKNK